MCIFAINKLSIYRKCAGAPPCSIHTHIWESKDRRRTHSPTSNLLFSQTPSGRSVGRSRKARNRHPSNDDEKKEKGERRGERSGDVTAGQKRPRKARGYFVPRWRPARALRRRDGLRKRRKREGDGEQRRRWRACRSGEKRDRYSEAFCERATPYHAAPRRRHAEPRRVPCQATPWLDRPPLRS